MWEYHQTDVSEDKIINKVYEPLSVFFEIIITFLHNF